MEQVQISEIKSRNKMHFPEGLFFGILVFSVIGLIFYYIESLNEISRAPSSIPQRSLQGSFLLQPILPQKPIVDIKKLTPENLTTNEKAEVVVAKIADKGINEYFNSNQFKQSKLGAISDDVKKTVKADVNVMRHKFSARLDPLQGKACFSYSGITNAEFDINPISQNYLFELKEQIGSKTQVFYQSEKLPTQLQNQIGFRLTW